MKLRRVWAMATASQENQALSTLALKAADYVNQQMDIGPDNDFIRNLTPNVVTKRWCVNYVRDRVTKELAELQKQREKFKQRQVGWADQLEAEASWARTMGCGNCGEYSALAFIYLRDVLKVKPLDWMDYNNLQHAFVVVGRDAGTVPTGEDGREEFFEPPDIRKWNTSCVICDAFYGRVLDYSHIVLTLGTKSSLRLLYRLE